jgi:hypothetical protein
MFNGLEHTAILSNFLTFITGSSSKLLRRYMDLYIFFKVDRGRIQTFSKEGANRGTQIQIFRRF